MIGKVAKGKTVRRNAPSLRTSEQQWYAPTVKDVYAQFQIAETMLARIPGPELAIVKREMGILEDMLWQFCH
jgi:hypothetical protein